MAVVAFQTDVEVLRDVPLSARRDAVVAPVERTSAAVGAILEPADAKVRTLLVAEDANATRTSRGQSRVADRTLGVVDLSLEVVTRSDHREVDLDASADCPAELVARMARAGVADCASNASCAGARGAHGGAVVAAADFMESAHD